MQRGLELVWRTAIPMLFVLHAPESAWGQTRHIRGAVVDGDDRPVPAASVQVANGSTVITDDSGRFWLEIAHRNTTTLDVRRIGFMPSRFGLVAGGDTSIRVMLLPMARELAAVNVTEKAVDLALDRSGFSQRLRERTHGTNSGIFITAKEIELRGATRATEMLEGLPAVTVRRYGDNQYRLIGAHLIYDERNRLQPCEVTVYLDGVRLNSLSNGGVPKDAASMPDIDGLAAPGDIAGMEYYPSGSRAPEKFQPLNGACGVVLVWTRHGG